MPDFPYPPRGGFNLRNWSLLSNLALRTQLNFVCRTREPVNPDYLDMCSERNISAQAIHIERPDSWNKIKKGMEFLVKGYPVTSAGWYFPRLESLVKNLVRNRNFDVIMLESTEMGLYWPAIRSTSALKVLDLHNLEGELTWDQAKLLPLGIKKLLYLYDAFQFNRLEQHLIRKVDFVMVTSPREKELLLEKNSNLQVEVLPNGVDCDAISPLPVPANENVLFVGAMDYLPNIDGVVFFVSEVLPYLRRRCPDINLWIVGKNPVPEIVSLKNVDGVRVIGEVDELEPYYRQCRLCVVPLRAGGGTRLKILEAMAYGRPVVSTSKGCEGLEVEHGKDLLIADDPETFSKAIIDLLSNPVLFRSFVDKGRQCVEQKYSWSTIVESFHKRLLAAREAKISQRGKSHTF